MWAMLRPHALRGTAACSATLAAAGLASGCGPAPHPPGPTPSACAATSARTGCPTPPTPGFSWSPDPAFTSKLSFAQPDGWTLSLNSDDENAVKVEPTDIVSATFTDPNVLSPYTNALIGVETRPGTAIPASDLRPFLTSLMSPRCSVTGSGSSAVGGEPSAWVTCAASDGEAAGMELIAVDHGGTTYIAAMSAGYEDFPRDEDVLASFVASWTWV